MNHKPNSTNDSLSPAFLLKEIEQKNIQLQIANRALRMIELKKEIAALKRKSDGAHGK